ncbi:MAG: hypothetical protein ABR555_15400, partial [Pyrinomonadaceae bacterium]
DEPLEAVPVVGLAVADVEPNRPGVPHTECPDGDCDWLRGGPVAPNDGHGREPAARRKWFPPIFR